MHVLYCAIYEQGRVNRETMWLVLEIYGVGRKGLAGIESNYEQGRVNRETMWPVLEIYGVGRKGLAGIESNYEQGSGCVKGLGT